MNTSASIKSLLTVPGITPESAFLIREAWTCPRSQLFAMLESHCPRTLEWVHSCYNEPKSREMRREAVNELSEMHGLELLGIHRRSGDYVYYCNAGGTYTATILFHGGALRVGCWGDMVERNAVNTDQEAVQRSFYS